MTFLNPVVLFGLVAAGIPILIHLLQLKKLHPVDFSSIRFLKELQHASAKRVRLRDYLLLLLRSLAIASLVVAFARPALKGFGSNNSKNSSVVILDDSPSTAVRNEYGEIFSQLKIAASNLMERFSVGNNVSLILTSHLAQAAQHDTLQIPSAMNPRFLLPAISAAEPTNVRVPYALAIGCALKRLQSSGFIDKEVYLFGDLQRTEFEARNENLPVQDNASSRETRNTRLFFFRTNESSGDNLSITGARFADPVVEVNSPAEIQATVANNGGTERASVVAGLYLDGRKAAQAVADLPPGATRKVSLAVNVADAGFHKGVVEIDDNSIQTDNRFYFSFFAIRKLNVVIVASGRGDDFVLEAVRAAMDTSISIDAKVVAPEQFAYTDLSNSDVVVIEDYASSQGFEGKLIQFAGKGGGVILFASVPSEASAFDGLLGSFRIGTRSRFFASSNGNFLSIDRIDAGDEFFSGIFSSRENAEQIKDKVVTKISNMAQLEPSPFAHVLMSTSAGPFLLSKEVGSGVVFVITSPPDSSSSSFTISPFFPVVIQRALFYSSAVKHKPIQIFAGERADYIYSLGGVRSAELIAPNGLKSEVVPAYVGGAAKFTLDGLTQLGTYSLTSGSTLCEISTNIDPRESDLAKASKAEVLDFAKRMGFSEKNVFVMTADKNAAASVERLRLGQDLSSIFAGIALLCLILEIFVSRMKTF